MPDLQLGLDHRPATRCGPCSRGPQGAEGHLDLFVFRMRGNHMQFTCRTCSGLWLRTAVDGGYRWSESKTELDAQTVPGSTDVPQRRR